MSLSAKKVALALALAAAAPLAGCERAASEPDKTRQETKMKDLKSKLSPMQFKVTQECGTEPPFNNEYWDNKRPGIYVDVVSGEPLFSSLDKYDSGSGWPSFTKPLKPSNVATKDDSSHGMV